MAKQQAKVAEEGSLLQLDPAVILADDNTRYSLKESRVSTLAKSILERGGVMEPVEIELLPTPENGHKYRLTTGFYRHAAVLNLNTTQAAGLLLPAIVRPVPDAKERVRRQIAENLERENQSPMDQAVAIKRLLDSGLSKMEVREVFARPGGRKGNKTQPASNSFINMTLSFLELPKAIQTKIHEGLVGVAAAYELTKVPAEKRAQVLERAEQERTKALEQEERDEEKILNLEKKQAVEAEKRNVLLKSSQDAEAKVTAAREVLATKTKEAEVAYNNSKLKHPDAKAKREAVNTFKAAENARVASEADVEVAQKEFEGVHVKFVKYETLAAEKAQKLREARAKAPKGNAKQVEAVGPGDVKKAAVKEKVSVRFVPLNLAEIRKVVSELALPGGSEKVVAIGKAFEKCLAGETTDKELYKELQGIVA